MNTLPLAARIAARKALGMTASEFNEHEAKLARDLKRAQQKAIRDALRLGCDRSSTEQQRKEAVERCELLGCCVQK